LKGHPAKVFGHVEGIAASAASFVLMAADTISMPEDAFIMIHNAHGGAMGDAQDLREMADIIDKLQGTILNIYEKRTGHDREALDAMMKAETWLTANEAMEFGFVDTVTDKMEVAAKINIFSRHFKEMPIEDPNSIDNINTITDFEKYLRDSGLSRGLATALTSRAKVVFQCEIEEADSSLKEIFERLDNLKIPDLN
jgi:membrane-bound ClpP family serine protease